MKQQVFPRTVLLVHVEELGVIIIVIFIVALLESLFKLFAGYDAIKPSAPICIPSWSKLDLH